MPYRCLPSIFTAFLFHYCRLAMPTFLFHDVIFGPVISRRLGVSLGVNLLPTSSKLCNFNCIYCECGWTLNKKSVPFPPRELVSRLLVERLQERHIKNEPIDVITFAGNGEPTIHPAFPEIIDDTLHARDLYFPAAKVVVLSNATMLYQTKIVDALKRVDQAALKFDSAIDETMHLINGPQMSLSVQQLEERLLAFGHQYTLQTLFLTGHYNGAVVDNTTPQELDAWLSLVERLRPRDVMIYTIDRETPASDLHKVPLDKLQSIAVQVERLGIATQVRG